VIEDLRHQRIRQVLATGTFEPCPDCSAGKPSGGVLPDGWQITTRNGRLPGRATTGLTYTTHAADCRSRT
jgi:hypothetical protein